MTTFHVTPATFPAALRRKLAQRQREVEQVAKNVAHRGLAHAVALTNEEGKVDLGGYKEGWAVRPYKGGAVLGNSAPYAAVIEHGRRPNMPGPPIDPIREWTHRKLGLDGTELERAAWAIRDKIHRDGTRPYYIMRRTATLMQGWLRTELRRRLAR